MPVILKCLLCGSLFDRDVYAYCPQCGGAQTQPAFKVDYSGTGYVPKKTGGSGTSGSSGFTPPPMPPPTPSPFHLLPSPPPQPTFTFGPTSSPQLPPPTTVTSVPPSSSPTFTFTFDPPSSSPPPTFNFTFGPSSSSSGSTGGSTPSPSPFSFGSLPGLSFGASSTSSPPSVQRKSKRFTHQLVIAVLTGTGDEAIETIAQDLQRKHPDMSSLIHVHRRKGNIFEPATHELMAISPSDKLAIQNATKVENQTENAATVEKCFVINTKKAPCRLYLVAHGDDGFNFAGLSGAHMAVFVRNALRISQVTCISVVSCYGAGYIPPLYNASDSREVNEQRIDAARRAPMDKSSFAAVFHRELKGKGLLTEVLARRANVNTDSRTLGKGTRFDPAFNRFDATAHKAPWSKFRFYWEGEAQKVAPVYSDGDTSAWPQDLT